MFLFLTYRKISKWWALIFIWPVMISYAQVYVGVHYPLDVIAGGVIGCIIGIAMAYLFTKQIGLINFDHQPGVQ
jgi:undecaprenyl-diphosphatase